MITLSWCLHNKFKELKELPDWFLINFGTNGKQIRISGSNLKKCIDNFDNSYPLLFRKWGFESTDLQDDVLGCNIVSFKITKVCLSWKVLEWMNAANSIFCNSINCILSTKQDYDCIRAKNNFEFPLVSSKIANNCSRSFFGK